MSTVIEYEKPITKEKDIHIELDDDLVQSLNVHKNLPEAQIENTEDDFIVINVSSKTKKEKRDNSYFLQLLKTALIMITMGVLIAMSMAYDGLLLYELTISSILIVLLMTFRLSELRRY